MKELYIFCEGQTEQGFCSRVLQTHFFPQHDGLVHPVRIAHSRRHNVIHRGGVRNYEVMKNEMLREFRRHRGPGVLFTSMIDLYRLPSNFPGKDAAARNPDNPRPYVELLESAFADDVADSRFVPHLQLHEFETLLFVEPEALKLSFEHIDSEVAELQKLANEAVDIEKINDTPTGAPSKRIIERIPRYEHEKTTVGPDVTEYVGMKKLMAACSHFRDWINFVADRLGAL